MPRKKPVQPAKKASSDEDRLEHSRAAGRALAPTSARLRELRDKKAVGAPAPSRHEQLVERAVADLEAVATDTTVAVEEHIRSLEKIRADVNQKLSAALKERERLTKE